MAEINVRREWVPASSKDVRMPAVFPGLIVEKWMNERRMEQNQPAIFVRQPVLKDEPAEVKGKK